LARLLIDGSGLGVGIARVGIRLVGTARVRITLVGIERVGIKRAPQS